jgi:hypothetical protein
MKTGQGSEWGRDILELPEKKKINQENGANCGILENRREVKSREEFGDIYWSGIKCDPLR